MLYPASIAQGGDKVAPYKAYDHGQMNLLPISFIDLKELLRGAAR